jgi:hypothetical protein
MSSTSKEALKGDTPADLRAHIRQEARQKPLLAGFFTKRNASAKAKAFP